MNQPMARVCPMRARLALNRWRAAACVWVCLWGVVGLAHAVTPSAVRAVRFTQANGEEQVRLELSAPLPQRPVVFALQDPPRIVVDLPGVRNQAEQSSFDIRQGSVRSVGLVEAEGRTRVVLQLTRPVPHEVRPQGAQLVVALQPAALASVDSAPASAAPLWAAAAEAPAASTALVDIDFRRGDEAAGQVIVQLGSAQQAVDIRPQGRSVVVEFIGASLPPGLRRRLDVSDFGTPVRMVTATSSGDRVRLVVENAGDWEHSAYQSDTKFVLEVRPLKPDPNKLVQGPKYSGEKLSLNFQNIDVRALLQVIADFTGFNVITSDSVQGSLTLRLKDVPWDQALDIILEAKQLGMTRTGNVIRVAPKKELDDEALARREIGKKLEELEPLRTEVFRLNFGKAKEVADVLNQRTVNADKGAGNRFLSERGSAVADERTNQVFVTDVAARLEAVREYIRRVDAPKRQVMIQARIVEANEGFSQSLGVRLGGADLRGVRGGDPGYSIGGGARVALGGSYNAIGGTTGQTDPLNFADTTMVNLPAKGDNVPRFALALFSPAANRFLNLELSALESDNNGRVISSPRVVTGDLGKAFIKQGQKVPFERLVTSPQGTQTVVEFIDAVLSLEVTPQITPSGQVLLQIKATKNQLDGFRGNNPIVGVKEAETEVMVENGGTVMLGGIFEASELNSVDKVPVLGDVPVLGHLFKRRSSDVVKRELLIFVTPTILADNASL
ncbi:Type IV pilus biogenesis and competence protein PilQ [Tepidimonas alkaliphilus]|uniref:Type IV pilus biogenesis and competence protein PilQ n=1 Tax=Tepidimonas alkaliphilus TaxID=2588942 RepID=A0A554W9G8_9BURK|nr:type IV pilus secretin family protein [Tepidimonas alkaliphilus]TSE20221.1 Type IV pilus biogenesis and competence protein PilQ [Tepidimonas alkaliphilus]